MIGKTIESQPGSVAGSIVWLVPAVGITALGLFVDQGATHALLAALPFWLLSFLWVWTREPRFLATFTPTALEVEEPACRVNYEEMQALLARYRPANPFQAGPRHYPIQIVFAEGVIRVPPKLNVASDEVYSFLYTRFTSHGSQAIHPDLLDYLRRKEKKYGGERVWSYRARRYRGQGGRAAKARVFLLALFLAGLGWILAGVGLHYEGWAFGGIAMAIVAGLFLLYYLVNARLHPVARKLQQASMIITPDGIALAQADLKGQLRWDEVRDVKYQHGKDLILKVEGALIPVADIYDRPLPLINQLIQFYWTRADGEGESRSPWRFDAAALDEAGQISSATDTHYTRERDR